MVLGLRDLGVGGMVEWTPGNIQTETQAATSIHQKKKNNTFNLNTKPLQSQPNKRKTQPTSAHAKLVVACVRGGSGCVRVRADGRMMVRAGGHECACVPGRACVDVSACGERGRACPGVRAWACVMRA